MLFAFNAAVVCWVLFCVLLLFTGTIPKRFEQLIMVGLQVFFYAGAGLFVFSLIIPFME